MIIREIDLNSCDTVNNITYVAIQSLGRRSHHNDIESDELSYQLFAGITEFKTKLAIQLRFNQFFLCL
jgi:hypothetical protein